ncbi:MAG: phenylalanine--tRNA ligase subunit alpha [Gemmatimonadota bacterium]|nr:phenylalanine--tRNA ligase subunit alpha [Gemmatimonadota bacterium]MDE2983486.1 phenylalanine--tRNA ligase subunit alpha [Gemmatimonadota bacterium]
MIEDLRRLEADARAAIRRASDTDELERVRVRYLGRREGRVSALLRQLGRLSREERPAAGAEANRVKTALVQAHEDRSRELAAATAHDPDRLDLTLPARGKWRGTVHPVSRVVDDIWQIFRSLGFVRARGPEVDTEWYNFVALNTPLDHPAADEQDTLYLAPGLLLRSHTSPVQIRTMEKYPPPIRIIAPGMVYRRDTYDATHTPAFAQIEGLVVDEGVTFVDFKATLAEFARRFWGPGTRVRFRPSFFPFTEPSAEVDVKRVIVREDGSEEETGWIEIMGAGMVDPAVLDNVGYDSERYTGWAFGMGPARVALLRHGVRDLRLFYENDMRFLGQFT